MQNEFLDIVVVDDNPILLSVLSEIFSECGHIVRTACDGFVALAEIRDRLPDLILSDLCMPGMSGYELLSVVRRRFPSIRVIAMSGAQSGIDVPPGVAADAFYAKGASSVAQLLQVVRTVSSAEPHSLRPVAPIWISEAFVAPVSSPELLVSCPECLRPFSRQVGTLTLLPGKGSCPHCLTPIELALVRTSHRTDESPLAAVAMAEPELTRVRCIGQTQIYDVLTERTNQQ